MANTKIGARLESVASDGIVAGADAIYDDELSMFQEDINDTLMGAVFIDEDDGTAAIAGFDPATDCLRKTAQTLTAAEKAQVKTNLGITDAESFYVPTLSAVPTESTLTYTQSGSTKNFIIGQYARVADNSSDLGYVFYQLYDLQTEGNTTTAVWDKMGSGEKVTGTIKVTLLSYINGSLSAGNDLTGATVTVTNTTDSETAATGTWAGSELIFSGLTPMKNYSVTVSTKAGYDTPSASTVSNLGIGEEKSLSFSYQGNEYSITISDNQNGSDTSNVEVTYDSTDYSSGGSIRVPASTTITTSDLSATVVSGYKQTISVTGKAISVLYQSELVTVTVNTDQNGVSAEGQEVTINGTAYTVGATGVVTAKIAFDTVYSITVDSKTSYTSPDTSSYASLTAGIDSRSITLTYTLITEELTTSYIIDQSNPSALAYVADQTKTWGYTSNIIVKDTPSKYSNDDDDVIHRIWSRSKLVAAQWDSTNSRLKYKEISRTDKTKWADNATIDNASSYDFFLKLPEFWWKCELVETDKYQITFTMDSTTGATWNHWAGNSFIGIYEGYIESSKLYSRRGVTPTVSQTWTTFTDNARARGGTNVFTCVSYEAHQIMALLGYGWLGTTNDQEVVGYCTDTYQKTTGGCDAKGMADTAHNVDGDTGSINFWGLENWWGDLYEWVDNVKTANTTYLLNIYAKDKSTVNRTVQSGATSSIYSGCIGKMVLGTNGDVVPAEFHSDSNYTSGFASYGMVTGSSGYVARRSGAAADAKGGLGHLNVGHSASSSGAYIGSRLLYEGDSIEIESF